MNVSLVKLRLNGLYNAPFFAAKKFISIHDSSIARSFNYFLLNSKNLRISKTNFDKFQSSVIIYESKSYKFTGYITGHLNIAGDSNEISIFDAVFTKCITDLDGGVLNHFSKREGNLICRNCMFINCHGIKYPGDGGCIYFTGNSSQISRCCVLECYNHRDGHFAAVSLRGSGDQNNHINETTCYSCSNEASWNTVYQSFGSIIESSNNFTKCTTHVQSCAFFIHSLYRSCIAKYMYVNGCHGAWCAFFYAKESSLVEESVFINNRVEKDQPIILFYKGGTICNCTLMKNNGCTNPFLPKSSDGFATIKDCTLDIEVNETGRCIFINIKRVSGSRTINIPNMFHTYVC
jgi:hypothetical protein